MACLDIWLAPRFAEEPADLCGVLRIGFEKGVARAFKLSPDPARPEPKDKGRLALGVEEPGGGLGGGKSGLAEAGAVLVFL